MSALGESASRTLFATGSVVATPAALRLLEQLGVDPWALLARHVSGDWGDFCDEDQEANERAVVQGTRVFSSYLVGTELAEAKVWLITEADRASSCLLLPEEY